MCLPRLIRVNCIGTFRVFRLLGDVFVRVTRRGTRQSRCRRRWNAGKIPKLAAKCKFQACNNRGQHFLPAQGVSSPLFSWCVVVGRPYNININILSGGIKIDGKRLSSLKTSLLCKPRLRRCFRASDEKVGLGGDHRNNKEIDRICNDFSGWSRMASRHCETFSSINRILMIFHFRQITLLAALDRFGPSQSLWATESHRAIPSHFAETRHRSSFPYFSAALIDIFRLPLNFSS